MDKELKIIREWAKNKIASGAEPPWAWYQYMKLIETTDAILTGMDSVTPKENLQQSEQRLETHLRLVDATYQPDNAPPHSDIGNVPLPM